MVVGIGRPCQTLPRLGKVSNRRRISLWRVQLAATAVAYPGFSAEAKALGLLQSAMSLTKLEQRVNHLLQES